MYVNLIAVLEKHVQERPRHLAYITAERRLTFAELEREVDGVARLLAQYGVAAGDSVGLMTWNTLDFVLAFLALQKLGAVIHLWNFRLTAQNIGDIMARVHARAIIFSPDFLSKVPAREGCVRVAAGAPAADWPADVVSLAAVPAGPPVQAVPRGPDDFSAVIYTSGTTGLPKGAAYTQRTQITSGLQYALEMGLSRRSIGISPAPLIHGGALNFWISYLVLGATFVLDGRYQAAEVLRLAQQHRVTEMMAVPTQVSDLTRTARELGFARGNLRLIRMGGSPYGRALIEEARAVFGCELANTYGMTENCANSTYMCTADCPPEQWTGIGRATHFWQVRLVRVDGDGVATPDDVVSAGERGQIIVRGPQQVHAYFPGTGGDVKLVEGWFYTRDVAEMDADGNLTIVDRVDHTIITGGENVYPQEVEAVLGTHPLVADVGVVGLPDPQWGETVTACVVARPGLTESDLEQLCRTRGDLAAYKRPRRFVFVAEIPRNVFGKIDRKALRTRCAEV